MVLCLLILKIANSAKMLTSAKKLLTSANFFIMYFYVSGHFEYFYFLLIQQSFWSKIAEVSNKKKKEILKFKTILSIFKLFLGFRYVNQHLFLLDLKFLNALHFYT